MTTHTTPPVITMVFAMAAETAACIRGVVPATLRKARAGATDCGTWRQLKSCGLQVAEMTGRQLCCAVALCTGDTFTYNMLIMLAGVITVVFRCP